MEEIEKGDKEKEDMIIEAQAQLILEEEKEGDREKEIITHGVTMREKEDGVLKEEGWILAMGAVEENAQRPKVIGGL